MRHGSLFSGIGGFDLAAEWMGWENIFHCEWNPFGQKILKHYWPNAASYTDIIQTDFSVHRGTIDILTGGFPCQPFSAAGKRKGKEDDRYLWPEMLRVIDEVRPTWICGENVAGIVSMVQPETFQTNLETQASILEEDDQTIVTELREYVIETICGDLERIGYSVQPVIIPACATGAPHRRDRVWFIANASGNGHELGRPGENRQKESQGKSLGNQREWVRSNSRGTGESGHATNTRSQGLPLGIQSSEWEDSGENASLPRGEPSRVSSAGNIANAVGRVEPFCGDASRVGRVQKQNKTGPWAEFPSQSPVCDGNDGFPGELDGITFSKWRNESIKGGGNAIVPQVAYQIFKAIEAYGRAAA